MGISSMSAAQWQEVMKNNRVGQMTVHENHKHLHPVSPDEEYKSSQQSKRTMSFEASVWTTEIME